VAAVEAAMAGPVAAAPRRLAVVPEAVG
jgi:hypothetical protein